MRILPCLAAAIIFTIMALIKKDTPEYIAYLTVKEVFIGLFFIEIGVYFLRKGKEEG